MDLQRSNPPNDHLIPRWELEIKRRFLPHWRMEGAWYFVTFNVWKGILSATEIALVRQHVIGCSPGLCYLSAVCVMPDHVHLILSPLDGIPLSKVMQKIKGTSALLINRARGTQGRLWQVESWDRILRDQDELAEKLGYMLQNPVDDGLTDDPWSWPGWYLNADPKKDTG